MTAAALIVHSPARAARLESMIVAGMIALVALVTGGYALTLGTGGDMKQELLDWQVSAFTGLGPDDQAIHSALLAAAEDIGSMNYDFGDWSKPEELAKLLIPPFYQDDFWEQHGKVDWELNKTADFNAGGDTSYIGHHGKAAGQSAYLLVFRHRHVGGNYTNQVDVWVHRNPDQNAPDALRAEQLAAAGWRQVIPYSGADEVARMKGN